MARGAWLALLLPAGAGSVEAAGVVGNGTPGSCTEAALNAALTGGGTVTFNCGGAPVVIPITSQKVIAVSTTVDGGSPDLITLDAGNGRRHFASRQSIGTPIALTVKNITLRNGRCPNPEPADPPNPSAGYGGSIRSGIDSPLTVQNSRFIDNACDVAGVDVGGGAIRQRRGALLVQGTLFQNNRAGNAGAISSSDAVATVEDSQFIGNTTNAHTTGFSGVGGGFYNDESGNGRVTIRRTLFQNNTATFAAGAVQSFFVPGDQGLSIEDCTFTNNSSPGAAGAILSQLGPLSITGSTFSGNSAGDGAGVYVNTSPTTITNSTFSGNTATGVGGGIFAGNSTVTISHVTVAGNLGGGGIVTSGTSGTLRGSIVASNTGGQCNTALTNGGGNVQFPSTGACPGATVADPLLGPLASNGGPTQTRAIPPGSPARDLVSSGCPPPATDQRGVARPANACDAGAFELTGTVSIGNDTVVEGTGAGGTATFDVTLSQASSSTVTVAYATANGTAVAPADYTAASGVVTFPPGVTARTIGVSLAGDAIDENDETFTVTLSNPSGAALGVATGTGTIQDDDAPPTVSIADCASAEGGVCAFGLSLSAVSGKMVSVSFATANGSAQGGSDFVAASGAVTFPPGQGGAVVNVQVLPDTVDEVDETFLVNLSAPTNATIADGQGTGFIDDDDGPSVVVSDQAVPEGAGPLTFVLSLSAASPQAVTYDFATVNGTADAGSDYMATSGTITFNPGVVTRLIGVNLTNDASNEPDERFFLDLSNPADGSIADGTGLGTIIDDDGGAFPLRALGHGSALRDGFAGGADLFAIDVPARTSWEVVVDETSGDASSGGPLVQRVGNDTTTVVQASSATGPGTGRSLAWSNTTSAPQAAYVRVASSQCSTACGPDDTYRIRAYETTLQIPRFNNGGGQLTVLVLQNPSSTTISGVAYFWSQAGVLLAQSQFTLAAHQSSSLVTTTIGGLVGQNGSVTIAHNGRYGALTGKTVSLDPNTGFSFDASAMPKVR